MDLKRRSKQRIFDYAVRHTIKQGQPGAVIDGGLSVCQYWNKDSHCRCTIGFLLDNPTCRTGTVNSQQDLAHLSRKKMALLVDLQVAHDSSASVGETWKKSKNPNFVADFKTRAAYVAGKHGLKWNF